jgi:hypothetical protein
MEKTIMRSVVLAAGLAVLVSVSVNAGPLQTLTLSPSGGTVSGLPGAVVGWGYDITNLDPNNWVLLDDSFVSGGLASGTFGGYVDYISSDFLAIDPSSSTGPVGFSQGTAGAGEFDIDQFVSVSTITGDVNIDYSVFSQDPNSPTFDPSSFVSNGTLTAAAEVDVAPEPAPFLTMSIALLLFGGAGWLRRKAKQA